MAVRRGRYREGGLNLFMLSEIFARAFLKDVRALRNVRWGVVGVLDGCEFSVGIDFSS